ncbi:MAG TPA: carboxymuconolactone decarboxylase family protein [Acidobacteriota bacterium]|nr:carboxymuconolactone decarboxylase family protein [Acidobacteriota bacterium]
MSRKLDEFREFRERMNDKILQADNKVVKRFFALDTQTYREGALSAKTKELLGLSASMVLRCDDCIAYHMIQCKQEGVSREEFFETFSVALIVGGSIVIPHLRRAVDLLEELETADQEEAP